MTTEMLPNWLKQRTFLTPDRTAVSSGERSLTFRELDHQAEEAAQRLNRLLNGAKPAFIGLMIKNRIESIIAVHAVQQLGMAAVMLNHRLGAGELTFQVRDMALTHVIHDEDFAEKAGTLDVEGIGLSFLFMGDKRPYAPRDHTNLDDTCTVMYTSGTTGSPKGVLQTYGNHWWSAIGSSLNLGTSEKDVWLCAVPLFHISGFSILMRSIIYGMEVRLHASFDEDAIDLELKSGRVTIISVVTNMLQRLMGRIGEGYHENLRCVLLGGGPAPLPLLQACKDKGVPVFQSYGMTETSSQIVTLSPEYSLSKLGSAGKPLFPSQLKIKGASAPLEEGEIMVKGPNVTMGYHERPEANEKSFEDGWLFTGDIGYVDEEGFLYVLDRRSDLIISGGENVYPAEVESVLLGIPGVTEAGVIGMDDPVWGQVPCAFLVTDRPMTEEEVMKGCKAALASYKCPKRIVFVGELPRNASNKLLRRVLKENMLKGIYDEA